MRHAYIIVLAFALALAACGTYESAVTRPDAGGPCGNGNTYCPASEVCVNGDCVPKCEAIAGGCETGR
jgi:hypothetical protein